MGKCLLEASNLIGARQLYESIKEQQIPARCEVICFVDPQIPVTGVET